MSKLPPLKDILESANREEVEIIVGEFIKVLPKNQWMSLPSGRSSAVEEASKMKVVGILPLFGIMGVSQELLLMSITKLDMIFSHISAANTFSKIKYRSHDRTYYNELFPSLYLGNKYYLDFDVYRRINYIMVSKQALKAHSVKDVEKQNIVYRNTNAIDSSCNLICILELSTRLANTFDYQKINMHQTKELKSTGTNDFGTNTSTVPTQNNIYFNNSNNNILMSTGTEILAGNDSLIASSYAEFEKNYPTMAKYGLHGKSNNQFKLLQELLLHWWNEGGKYIFCGKRIMIISYLKSLLGIGKCLVSCPIQNMKSTTIK